MKLILLGILVALSLAISVHCYEFYTTAKENRYKFRYWFSIGVLSVFHLLLAIYAEYTGDKQFNELRWLIFMIQDILLLEIFAYNMIKRKMELFIRPAYYFLCAISIYHFFWGYDVIISMTLIYLTWSNPNYPLKRHFMLTFTLYVLTTIVPVIWGFGTHASFLIGIIFLSHMLWGVFKLYQLEQVEQCIQQEALRGEQQHEAIQRK